MRLLEARPRVRVAAMLLALLCGMFACGCNALVDTSTAQCETNADCRKSSREFANTFCSPDKVCKPLSLPCTTSRDCSERLDEPAYCRPDGVCTRVLTPECTQIVPDGALSRDHVILTGFMAPVHGQSASEGTPLRQGAELALREIEAVTNGIPSADAGPQPHLAMLVCHDSPDALNALERPINVARHLVDTVRVPAIIGPSKRPPNAVDIITEVTSPGGVLTLSPSATHARIPDLEKAGLFWRTVPSDEILVDAWRYLILGVSQSLWEKGIVPKTEPPKIIYVARADSYGATLRDQFREEILTEPPATYVYDLGKEVDWESMANEIAAARPNVLFAFSTSEFVRELLPRIEQRWSGGKRPYYMLFEGNQVPELLAEVDKNQELGTRILGTAPGTRRSELFTVFRGRFEQAFGHTPGSLAEFAYDAAYLLAYAVARAKKQHPTGLELARAMRTMSCISAIKVHASEATLAAGFGAAAEAACVNFEGASGPLDFDNDTGQAPNDYGVWCAARDASGNAFPSLEDIYFDVEGPGIGGWAAGQFLPFCPGAQ